MSPRAFAFAAAMLLGAGVGLARTAHAETEAAPEPETPTATPAPAKVAAPNLKVVKLQFRGNRKVEDDAIKVNLKTAPGVTLTQEMVRDDVRAIWKMGYFEDIEVEVGEGKIKGQPGSAVGSTVP